jgi:hypothetical protein
MALNDSMTHFSLAIVALATAIIFRALKKCKIDNPREKG